MTTIGTVKLSNPLVENASASVVTIGIRIRKNKLFVGSKTKVTAAATTKNANEPANVFCSFAMMYFPKGTLFPKSAAAGSAKAIVNIGIKK